MSRKELIKQIDRFDRSGFSSKYWNDQKEQLKQIRKTAKDTIKDKKLWGKFKEGIEFYKNPDNWNGKLLNKDFLDKFWIEHIDYLGLNPDIVFFQGPKGIGKTVQISRIISEQLEKGKKVILLRNHKEDMVALMDQINNDPWYPIRMEATQKLYLKGSQSKKSVGFATYIYGTGLESRQGPSYLDYGCIIWDECNITGGTFDLKPIDMRRFTIFCSSIIRDKKDFKIWMFGNYLRNQDGTTHNIILEAWKIPASTKLRTLEFLSPDGKHKTKFLYINAVNLYKGIQSQKGVPLLEGEVLNDLLSNQPQARTLKIVSRRELISLEPIVSLAFIYDKSVYCLYLAGEYIEKKEAYYYVLNIEEYNDKKNYGFITLTNSTVIHNSYKKIQLIDEENWAFKLQWIYGVTLSMNLFFCGEWTQQIFYELMPQWEKRYNLKFESSEWI